MTDRKRDPAADEESAEKRNETETRPRDKKRRAGLRVESLEPRILLSASWVDANVDAEALEAAAEGADEAAAEDLSAAQEEGGGLFDLPSGREDAGDEGDDDRRRGGDDDDDDDDDDERRGRGMGAGGGSAQDDAGREGGPGRGAEQGEGVGQGRGVGAGVGGGFAYGHAEQGSGGQGEGDHGKGGRGQGDNGQDGGRDGGPGRGAEHGEGVGNGRGMGAGVGGGFAHGHGEHGQGGGPDSGGEPAAGVEADPVGGVAQGHAAEPTAGGEAAESGASEGSTAGEAAQAGEASGEGTQSVSFSDPEPGATYQVEAGTARVDLGGFERADASFEHGAITVDLGNGESFRIEHEGLSTVEFGDGSVDFVVWDGEGGSSDWADPANWSGDAMPDGNDILVFDGSSSDHADLSGENVQVGGIQVAESYRGTLTLGDSVQVDGDMSIAGGRVVAGSALDVDGDLRVNGGRLVAGDGTLSVSGDFEVDGGRFVAGSGTLALDGAGDQAIRADGVRLPDLVIDKPDGTLTLEGEVVLRGDFHHVSGDVVTHGSTVTFEGHGATISASDVSFDDVNLNAGKLTIEGGLDVDGDLTIERLGRLDGDALHAGGNVTTLDPQISGSATIVLDGAGDQVVGAQGGTGELRNLSIEKAEGSVVLQDDLQISGNFTHVSGDVQADGSTVTFQGSGGTISAEGMSFDDVKLDAGRLTIEGGLDVDGDLTIERLGRLDGDALHAGGNVTTLDSTIGGSATIVLDGSGDQVVGADGGTGELRHLSIEKAEGSVVLQDDLQISGDFTHVSGDVQTEGSSVTFQGDGATISASEVTFDEVKLQAGKLTIEGDLDVDGDLTIEKLHRLNGDTLHASGDVTTLDSKIAGNATIVLDGAGDQVVGADGGTGELRHLSIEKAEGSVVLQDDLQISGDFTHVSGDVQTEGSTVTFQGDGATISAEGMTFDDVTLDAGKLTLEGDLDVDGDLTIERLHRLNGDTLHAGGNVTTLDAKIGGSATIVLDGAGEQVVSTDGGAGELHNLTIEKADGSVVLQDDLQITGDFTHVSGDVQTEGATVIFQGSGGTISASDVTFEDVTLQAGKLTIEGDLDVDGDLTIAKLGRLDGDTLHASGNVTTLDAKFGGSATIVLDGAGDQVVGTQGGAGELHHLTIDKPDGSVVLQDDLEISGDFTHVAGEVDTQGSMVTFQGSGNTISASEVSFGDVTLDGGRFTVEGGLEVEGDLTIEGLRRLDGDVIHVQGNVELEDAKFTGTGRIVQATSITLAEDGSQTSESVIDHIIDASGDSLSVESFTQPENGNVVHEGDGRFTYTPSPDFNGSDSFTFSVTDGKGDVTSETVMITVQPDAEEHSVDAGADTIAQEGDAVTLSATTSEYESEDVSYTWTQLEGPPVELTGADSASPGFTAPNLAANADMVFQVEVSDGTNVTLDTVTVAVQAVDDAPAIDAGSPMQAEEGETVQLTASAADAEGQDMQYAWTQVSGPPVELAGADGLSPSFEAPEGLVNTDIVFQLEATDGTNSVTDTVTVTVAADDDAASVDAGIDQRVEEGGEVQLSARADDPEGRPLTYSWTQLEGPPIAMSGADSASPGFTAPNLAANADMVFQVEVSDGTNVTLDTVTVAVQAVDDAPAIDAGSPMQAEEGETVQLTASAADAEGQDMQYAWTQVSGPPVELAGADGLSPSFEAPEGLVNTDIVFQFEATDGTNSVTDTVTVTVAADDDAASVDAGIDQRVEEGGEVQLSARADDPEGRPLTYSWTQLEGPPIAMSGADSASPGFTAPNLAANADMVFQVEVSDGTNVTTDTVTVAVQADDDAPMIDVGGDLQAEEGESVRLTARAADVEGQDMQFRWTQVSGPAVELSDAESLSPSFQAPEGLVNTDIVFQLEATDGTNSVTDTVTVTVAADDDAASVDAGIDQRVEEGGEVQLSARADDPEGRPLTYTWTQLEGPPIAMSGADSASPGFTAPNFAADTDLVLQVEVSDGTNITVDTVTVAVQANDDAPVVDAGSPVQAQEGEVVQLTASAADAEGQDMQYVWTQVSGPPVELTGADGLSPSFQAPEGLVNTEVVFQLEASDGTSNVTDTVTVTVAADDDAPSVNAGIDQRVEEGHEVQLSARADDPEGRPLTYRWTQLEGPPVAVSGADSASPGFSAPNLAANADITFQVEVSDGTNVTTDTVTVAVQANDDSPVIDAGSTLQAAEGETVRLSASAADAEGQDMQYAWIQVSGPPVQLADAESLTPSFQAPEGLVNTDFVFQLEATDGTSSVTDTVTVSVAADDDAPSVTAGVDQRVEPSEDVRLSARADDPEGRPMTYQWTQLSGTSVTLDAADSATPAFTAPILLADEDLVLQVEVSDGTHVTLDTVTVSVAASEAAIQSAAASSSPDTARLTSPGDDLSGDIDAAFAYGEGLESMAVLDATQEQSGRVQVNATPPEVRISDALDLAMGGEVTEQVREAFDGEVTELAIARAASEFEDVAFAAQRAGRFQEAFEAEAATVGELDASPDSQPFTPEEDAASEPVEQGFFASLLSLFRLSGGPAKRAETYSESAEDQIRRGNR